ncbi:hypothetical protein Glove_344g38 [Diversispora epigaea]|uniref:Uncharacterized protein n=1 Tax=Diversispora epigaea TaxID=1348612 RepID=A0A397HFX3_9GLOM|nr:hypothetical protein Glove_344g38 [Diversispora epigaea]
MAKRLNKETLSNKTSLNVDFSTLNNQNSNPLDICNQFISQDCISCSSDIVLFAGAAIDNDQITTSSTNVNNIEETTGKIQENSTRAQCIYYIS